MIKEAFEKKILVGLLIVSLFFSYFISTYKRFSQFDYWKKNREIFFAKDGKPLMTTLDAYHFLKSAKDFENISLLDYAKLSLFKEPRAKRESLLPFLIAKVSTSTGNDFYSAGICLTNLLAGLFTIPLIIYFHRNALLSVGFSGALFGSFSIAYYSRSSTGRVDTDTLNMFFPFFVSLMIFLAGENRGKIKAYLYSALAGFGMFLHILWYKKPGFVLPFFVVLMLYAFIKKFRWKEIAFCGLIFILFSHPVNFKDSFQSLWYFIEESGYIRFTSLAIAGISPVETISELKKDPPMELLKLGINHKIFSVLAFIGFGWLCLYKRSSMIPLIPPVALGLLSFVGGKRFVMYLSPFLGLGLGFLIFMVFKGLIEKFFKAKKNLLPEISAFLAILLFFFATASRITAYNKIYYPSLSANIINSMLDLKSILPGDTYMFTWWDYGYALKEVGEFKVFHDGGTGPVFGEPVATAFAMPDQQRMYNLINAISNGKFKTTQEALEFKEDKPKPTVAVFFADDMILKFGTISKFRLGFPSNSSKALIYSPIKCHKMDGLYLYCENTIIDMKNGKINKVFPYRRLVIVKSGKVTLEKFFGGDKNITVEVILREDNKFYGVFLIEEDTYRSNFNQLFLLGRFDENLFYEIYSNPPFVRVFGLK